MRIILTGLGRDTHPTGICRVAANLVRTLLSAKGVERVFFAIGSWQNELYRELLGPDLDRVDLIVANIKNSSLSRNYWFATSVPAMAHRVGPDLVHYSFPAPVLRHLFHCPVVVTLNDLYAYDAPENFGFPRYYANRLILRQCLNNVDGIACISSFTKFRLQEIFPRISRRIPVVVTGCYVPISRDAFKAPATRKALENSRFFLSVAQHRKNKNLDVLIRGHAQLYKCGTFPFPLVIVGSAGPETGHLCELVASLDMESEVHFVNSISDAELGWLYSNCSALVVCSSIEGYCLPVVEAQAYHARVVCSDIEVLREVGGEQCVYYSLRGDVVRNLTDAIVGALGLEPSGGRDDSDVIGKTVLQEYEHLYSLVTT